MKKRFPVFLLALVMICALIPAPAAFAADGSPFISNNARNNSYNVWASTVDSYLYENGSGGLTRVEYIPRETNSQYVDGSWESVVTREDMVLVEEYNENFEFLSSRTLPMELPIWGGFFTGEEYNFLIFGQDNVEENDSKEVIRVVKYSKNWERLGSAGLYGANTIHPFDAGALRCGEYGGTLFIRTCHEMYTSSDGRNHQANLTMAVDESAMEVTDSYYIVMNNSVGYVSHSFNQFVIMDDQGRIVTVDHGDAYPRGICLMVYDTPASAGKFSGSVDMAEICAIPGATGDNATGASVGGLAETGAGYVVAYNYDGTGTSYTHGTRYPYLALVDKSTLSVRVAALSDSNSRTPALAPTGADGGWVLWNSYDEERPKEDVLNYARYSSDGSVGQIMTATAALSDCEPIQYKGNTVWYVCDGSTICFYTLDSAGKLTPHEALGFTDVHSSDYFYEPVKWALRNEITKGDGSTTTFNPEGKCTRAQVLTFLWRAFGGDMWTYTPALFDDVKETDYFFFPVNWAYHENMLTRASRLLDPEAPCPRSEIILYMWRSAGCPTPTVANPFTDISPSDSFYTAALWAYESEITKGDGSAATFNPNGTCTRAQVVTFLQRMDNWKNGK